MTEVQEVLDERFGVEEGDFTNSSIGPTFGQQIAQTALLAIIGSLLVISLYIGVRFEFKYAVPVLIALFHDLLITAGVYALAGREVTTSTVAALLTILGFSLYDTIIVFDRIRENVPRMPRATFAQIVNRSMSEVLTRSLVTNLCTLFPVAALMIFGGETLRDFGFALLVGVASGTYSSIFIAAPVLTAWKEREPIYRRRHEIAAAEHGGVVPAFAVGGAEAGPGRRVRPDVAREPAAVGARAAGSRDGRGRRRGSGAANGGSAGGGGSSDRVDEGRSGGGASSPNGLDEGRSAGAAEGLDGPRTDSRPGERDRPDGGGIPHPARPPSPTGDDAPGPMPHPAGPPAAAGARAGENGGDGDRSTRNRRRKRHGRR